MVIRRWIRARMPARRWLWGWKDEPWIMAPVKVGLRKILNEGVRELWFNTRWTVRSKKFKDGVPVSMVNFMEGWKEFKTLRKVVGSE